VTERDIVDFFAALSRGEIEPIADRVAEDVVLEFPGRRFGARIEGRRRVTVFLKQNQRLFRGGLRFTVHWAGIAGDRAVAQWTNAGVTRDGIEYANRGVTLFLLDHGLISEIHDYLDTERIAETWPT
jgi:ketosteroid isomerase-like protein